MAAAHYKLDNLTAIIDHNTLQITGRTRDVCSNEPLDEKFAAFGWEVRTVDGHDFAAADRSLAPARPASRVRHRQHHQRQGRQLHGGRRQMASRRAERGGICRRPGRTRRRDTPSRESRRCRMSAPAPSMYTPRSQSHGRKARPEDGPRQSRRIRRHAARSWRKPIATFSPSPATRAAPASSDRSPPRCPSRSSKSASPSKISSASPPVWPPRENCLRRFARVFPHRPLAGADQKRCRLFRHPVTLIGISRRRQLRRARQRIIRCTTSRRCARFTISTSSSPPTISKPAKSSAKLRIAISPFTPLRQSRALSPACASNRISTSAKRGCFAKATMSRSSRPAKP